MSKMILDFFGKQKVPEDDLPTVTQPEKCLGECEAWEGNIPEILTTAIPSIISQASALLQGDLSAGKDEKPCQPILQIYSQKMNEKVKHHFNPAMYKKFPLIEYLVQAGAVFCLWGALHSVRNK